MIGEYEPVQNLNELEQLVRIFKEENVRSYLEIGAKFGGSLWALGTAMPKGSRIVAIDLPFGTFKWPDSERSLRECAERLRQEFNHKVTLLWGNCTTLWIIEEAKANGPYDAVFIDANHTRKFVEHDWKVYGPMAPMVCFHDIGWVDKKGIDVPAFWNDVKRQYEHHEICAEPGKNGIGVLWR